mgnify:CR=1 FL=1
MMTISSRAYRIIRMPGNGCSRVEMIASKKAEMTGEEAPTAWLSNAAEAARLFGYPRISLASMMDWVADWVSRSGRSLGKPTHFEVRDGTY